MIRKKFIYISQCCPNQPMPNWPDSDICPNCKEHTNADLVRLCKCCNDFLEDEIGDVCEVCAKYKNLTKKER